MRKQIISDQELIQKYIDGNEACLKMLIKRHQTKLFSYILFTVKDRCLAEDIFQDTFLKVINTIKNQKYKEEGKFYQWIIRISRNLIIDYFRKTSKMPLVTDSEGNDIFATINIVQENKEEEIIRGQTESTVRRLIQELPREQKEVLILRHYANISFKEIADLTDVSINTALGRMRYALLNLKKLIVKYNITI